MPTELERRATKAWSTATWSAPVVVQLILALVIVISWRLGKALTGIHGPVQFLLAAAIVALLSAAVSVPLLRSGSPRARGLGLSIAASYAVVFFAIVVFGYWILEW